MRNISYLFILLFSILAFSAHSLSALDLSNQINDSDENSSHIKATEESDSSPKLFGLSVFVQGGGSIIIQNHKYDTNPSNTYTMVYGGVVEGGVIFEFLRYFYLNISSGLSSVPDDYVLNLSAGIYIPDSYMYIGAGVQAPFFIFSNKIVENPAITGNPIALTPYVELMFDIPLIKNIMSLTFMSRYHFTMHTPKYNGVIEMLAGLKFDII